MYTKAPTPELVLKPSLMPMQLPHRLSVPLTVSCLDRCNYRKEWVLKARENLKESARCQDGGLFFWAEGR